MNVRSLRPNANLQNLKKQAKQLLRAAKNNDPKALARFHQCFDPEAPIGLKRAQLVLAREYGFASWNKLASVVESKSKSHSAAVVSPAAEHDFLRYFHAGNLAAAKKIVNTSPNLLAGVDYQAHHLLRAFVDANSGHCYKKAHLEIAELLTHRHVLTFRDAVMDDNVAAAQGMLVDDPKLVSAEFTAGRGIAQAIHHFRSLEMAAALVDAGADVNTRTTVHHVGDTPVGLQLRFGTVEAVEYLLDRGADPNGGLLKFMHAASMPTLVPLLLTYGWDINEGRGVRTLLHHDAAHGHTAKMRILLSNGADPDARDANGRTPLHLVALAAKSENAIRVLVEAGASLNAKDCEAKTPCDYARQAKCSASIWDLLS